MKVYILFTLDGSIYGIYTSLNRAKEIQEEMITAPFEVRLFLEQYPVESE